MKCILCPFTVLVLGAIWASSVFVLNLTVNI
jgi:hypothetical protein